MKIVKFNLILNYKLNKKPKKLHIGYKIKHKYNNKNTAKPISIETEKFQSLVNMAVPIFIEGRYHYNIAN